MFIFVCVRVDNLLKKMIVELYSHFWACLSNSPSSCFVLKCVYLVYHLRANSHLKFRRDLYQMIPDLLIKLGKDILSFSKAFIPLK